MTTNIVCSDTYIDAFSRLDKKIQKKSLETIRLMKRSLRSDSLKIEKLNTKLDFKSARVTQDFRVIFTQSGNTVLLVYIDHHDNAYLWAHNRLQGFDTSNAKPIHEYFEQSKKDAFDSLENESSDSTSNTISVETTNRTRFDPETGALLDAYDNGIHNQPDREICNNYVPSVTQISLWKLFNNIFFALFFFILGGVVGIIIAIGFF